MIAVVLVITHHSQTIDDFLPETNFEHNTDDDPDNIKVIESECEPNEYKLKGDVKLVKRKKPKIIRYVRYNKDKDAENHYRVFSPSRNKNLNHKPFSG